MTHTTFINTTTTITIMTITMMQEKYWPMSGVLLLGGCMAETMLRKKVRDIRIVMQRVSFSPESGGVWKPKITWGMRWRRRGRMGWRDGG
jgi:hypothetical protein